MTEVSLFASRAIHLCPRCTKKPRPRPGAIGCRAKKLTLTLATLAALAWIALTALAALLAALPRLLLLLTRLLLSAAALLATLATLTAALTAALVLLAALILLARLLFVGVHECSFNLLPAVTTRPPKLSSSKHWVANAIPRRGRAARVDRNLISWGNVCVPSRRASPVEPDIASNAS
jgi:hypothetical protein